MNEYSHWQAPDFLFGMRQRVRTQDGLGTVIGRAEHAASEPTYLVRDFESNSLTEGTSRREADLVAA